MPLTLTSPAFEDGGAIPVRYTRDGENVSPPLRWTGIPEGTRSLIIVMQDPDAPSGTFGHWAVFDMPPEKSELPEAEGGEPGAGALRQGKNDFDNSYYDGPEPPRGHGVRHYHFRIAALDVPSLSLPAQIGVGRLWEEARKHLIEEAELVGLYERK